MEIRRLQSFVRVAELGSLGKAADVLRIAQPALTRQMRLLEEELGVVLFNRTRRGMQLTEEGEQLLSGVLGPLHQVEMTLQNIRSLSSSVVGNLVIGMPPTTALVLARPLIQRLAIEEPLIQLHIIEGSTRAITEWILSGEIDIALLYAPLPDNRLVARDLLREDLMLVGSAQVGLSPDRPIHFKALMELPLIFPNPRNGIRSIVDRVSARHGLMLKPKCVIDSFNVTKAMVESGEGYALLPLSAIMAEVETGVLSYCPIESPHTVRQLMSVGRRDTRIPRIVRTVEVLLAREVVALNQADKWPGELLVKNADLA
jgi:LysR family nitrogen assimilation transcriptional regulator